MDNAFKSLVALTCIAVLGAIGWYFYNERQAYLAEQRRAEINAKVDAVEVELLRKQVERQKDAFEMNRLTTGLCGEMAKATIPDAPGAAPKTTEHAADLKLCAKYDRLEAYEKHQLELSGVL